MRTETRLDEYDAVIRTDRCDATLVLAVAALREQTLPPRQIIFVDSSANDACTDQLRALGGQVVIYPAEPFNFAKAINIGITAAAAPHVLLMSSHVVLSSSNIVSQGCELARSQEINALYWRVTESNDVVASAIDRQTFNGINGLSNACAMLPRHSVLQRPFREDVFSAEDQEWAGWYLREKGVRILQIKHPLVLYLNQHVNALKTVNEEIAIAYFSDRRRLGPHWIAGRLLRALLATLRRRPDKARMHWEIAKGLFFANFSKPIRKSRYY